MGNVKAGIQFIKIELFLNRKLILWLSLVFSLLFILTAKTVPQLSPLYDIALFGGGLLMSSVAFKKIHEKNTAMLYMTLPVSTITRYLSLWLLTGPVYLIFITLLYGMGMMISIFQGFFFFIDMFSFFHICLNYLILNAIFLWGSITFKKLPLIKTLFSLLLLGIILAIIKGIIFQGPWLIFISYQWTQSVWLALGVVAFISAYYQFKKCEIK